MADRMVDISVILPIYNQADHVERIVSGLVAALSHFKHTIELLLVVNGNKDNSLECCRQIARTHSQVHIIHLEIPGWGRAVRAGLAEARGNILCYTNAARTSPEVLALHIMLALANPGFAIKASRRLRHPLFRDWVPWFTTLSAALCITCPSGTSMEHQKSSAGMLTICSTCGKMAT